eukprot:10210356-Karenia_brevis.AAC.1
MRLGSRSCLGFWVPLMLEQLEQFMRGRMFWTSWVLQWILLVPRELLWKAGFASSMACGPSAVVLYVVVPFPWHADSKTSTRGACAACSGPLDLGGILTARKHPDLQGLKTI